MNVELILPLVVAVLQGAVPAEPLASADQVDVVRVDGGACAAPSVVLPPAPDESANDDELGELVVPNRLKAPPLASAKGLDPARDLMSLATVGADGRLAVEGRRLTIVPPLQQQLKDTLKLYQTPWAAAVVLEPSTGRVLAMAEHSENAPGLTGMCVSPWFPAASVFKLVTAAALLKAGATPETTACFHGGKRQVPQSLLEDSPHDVRCQSLQTAIGKSTNVVVAKLAKKYLDADALSLAAKAFHFNRPFSFAVPTAPSLAAIPSAPYELALTSAGFGDVFMSPLHGAALAATIANKGLWRSPVLFDDAVAQTEQALDPNVAEALTSMMEQTITDGTARRVFRERGFTVPGAVGKTGALADKRPFRDYSLFVGFAPKDDPKVAVGTVVVNDPRWRIRAAWLGREALRLGLKAATSQTAPPTPPSLPAPLTR